MSEPSGEWILQAVHRLHLPLTPMPRPAGQCSFPHSPRKAKLGPNKRRLFPAAPPGVVCDAEMKTRRPFGMEKCTLL